MGWQKIETCPEDEEVLLYFPLVKATREWGVGSPPRMKAGKVWQHTHDRIPPTHWMPLPDPPQEITDGE